MYIRHKTWMLVITAALLALPAFAADEVIPATSEDIEAFDKALTQTRERVRTRTRTEKQLSDEAATEAREMKRAQDPQDQTRQRLQRQIEDGQGAMVRTRAMHDSSGGEGNRFGGTRTPNKKQLSDEVATEAREMKQAREHAQDQTRQRLQRQIEDGQGAMERTSAMRDYSSGEGNRFGREGHHGGSESSGAGGTGGGNSGGQGQNSGQGNGR